MPKIVSVELDAELEPKFTTVKASMGVKFNRSVLRMLICDRYEELRRK